MKPGDKVIVIATEEQLIQIGMDDNKINNNLRKYESTISEELIKGKFKDENGVQHSSFVLDNTFVIPGPYLKLSNEKQTTIEKQKTQTSFVANKNLIIKKQNIVENKNNDEKNLNQQNENEQQESAEEQIEEDEEQEIEEEEIEEKEDLEDNGEPE